ncbi:MAG: hypothetical protein LBK53_08095 [Heliobacteriaceae bacterium]|jgi:hypothetical protein|nr:hypothetical protein [Heliobacteriaceae bacterium]
MFNLKKRIKDLARTAVVLAEEELGGETGRRKKAAAIEYVVSNIPVPALFRSLIAGFLAGFIDDAIEFAVEQMKTFAKE